MSTPSPPGAQKQWRLAIAAGAVTAVVLIGWIDVETGPEVGLSLLYLLPVAVAAWYTSQRTAVAIACLAAASWLVADLAWRVGTQAMWISAWNSFSRLVIFVSEAVLIGLARRDRERLQSLAAQESRLARCDPTTGLLNVRGFIEAVELQIADAREHGTALAGIYVDLDNFKSFNDRLGHAAGDAILVEVARTIGVEHPRAGHAARIGGDEFALVVPDLRMEEAVTLAETIVAAIRQMGSAYPDLRFGATAGVAFFDTPPPDAETVLRAADDAMYAAKAAGKSRVGVHHGSN